MVPKGQEIEENNKFVPLNRTLANLYPEALRTLIMLEMFVFSGLPERIPYGGNADYSSRLDKIDIPGITDGTRKQ